MQFKELLNKYPLQLTLFLFILVLTGLMLQTPQKVNIIVEPDILVQYYEVPPASYTAKEYDCLSKAIYYEAGNQSQEGKEAVALVIMNRLKEGFAKSICGVTNQKRYFKDRIVCQFSFACEQKQFPEGPNWAESAIVADRALKNLFTYDTIQKVGNALYFHADYAKPDWRNKLTYLHQIDNHIFYTN
jgi:spore germination cell wall hydrolase CwlJ-like protein